MRHAMMNASSKLTSVLVVLVMTLVTVPRTCGLDVERQASPRRLSGARASICGASCLRLRGGGFLSSSAPSFGLNAKELAQLRELRDALGSKIASKHADLGTDDRLVRLLRINQHDIKRTVKFWDNMRTWRDKLGCYDIRKEVERQFTENFWDMACVPARDKMRKYYLFIANYAVTNQGDLVSVECTGRIKVRQLTQEVDEHEMIRFWCYLMEWNSIKLARLSRKHNCIAGMVQIKDLDGLTAMEATCATGHLRFAKINRMLHDVYPETLSRLIVINIPPMFGMVWRFFKPLLPAATRRKISCTKRSSGKQHDVLSEQLSSSDLILLNGDTHICLQREFATSDFHAAPTHCAAADDVHLAPPPRAILFGGTTLAFSAVAMFALRMINAGASDGPDLPEESAFLKTRHRRFRRKQPGSGHLI